MSKCQAQSSVTKQHRMCQLLTLLLPLTGQADLPPSRCFSPVISRVGMGLVFAVPMAGGISDMRADAGSPTSLSLRKRPLLCTQGPRTHPDPSVSSPGSPLPFEAFAF